MLADLRKFPALVIALLIAIAALAEGTRTWEQSKFEELTKGTATGVAIRSIGGLELAPAFKVLYTAPSTYIWAITSDDAGNIYVADRSNRRIQVFDHDGTFLRQFTIDVPYSGKPNVMIGAMPGSGDPLAASGAPWAICITPAPNQVLYSADAVPGRIYKLTLDGKVLGVLGEAGKEPKQFGWIHEIACPSENVLYVAELLNWRVQKLVLHPSDSDQNRKK